MANLKEIKDRIASVQSTLKITSAMKMVSASKLRKAQNAVLQMRPYAKKLETILTETILTSYDECMKLPLMRQDDEIKRVLFIVVASNKGLCGNFNSEIIKNTVNTINTNYRQLLDTGNIDFMTFGKKATEYFRKKHYNIIHEYDELLNGLSYADISEITENIIQQYTSGYYSKVIIIYNHFKNVTSRIVEIEDFLPYTTLMPSLATAKQSENSMILFPDQYEVMQNLIPKHLKIQLFKALLESITSEQGARMTAMHKASDNATEIINSLKLKHNKLRQANITNQLIEIISGADALSK